MQAVFAALAILVLGAAFQMPKARAESPATIDRDFALRTIDNLIRDLDKLEDTNEDNQNKNDRKAAREHINSMRRNLEQLKAAVERAPVGMAGNPGPLPPTPAQTWVAPVGTPVAVATPFSTAAPSSTPFATPSPPVEDAMSAGDFSLFTADVKKAPFSKDKLALVQERAKQNNFTADQVIQVMGLLSYSTDKVTAGAALYPRVVDKANWFKVYNSLTFTSDRDRLRKMTSGGP